MTRTTMRATETRGERALATVVYELQSIEGGTETPFKPRNAFGPPFVMQ